MPLTMRPWSVNCYVLSKVWFKCGTVDLRVSDLAASKTSVKSWLYADLWEKPLSEAVMCRPPSHGGLGVASVQFKARALLIRTFLETAAIPKFRHSLLHSLLYRFHVLDDHSIPDPGFPPYYPPEFFAMIKKVHTVTPLNILTMSTKQWTRHLTEDGLTMELVSEQHQYIPCRAEILSPLNDWSISWRLCRPRDLGSDLCSFNSKLLHGLLVTRHRLHHMNQVASATCTLCSDDNEEDIAHALVYCGYNDSVGHDLHIVQDYVPGLTVASMLRFELSNLEEETELAVVTFISALLLEKYGIGD